MKHLLLLITFWPLFLWSQNYPLSPQNQQHKIAGTVGELRGSGSRFHYGIDFPAAAGTNVYAIEDGMIENITNKQLTIGRFAYVHVVPIAVIANGMKTSALAGEKIGTIQNIKNDHVHIQLANGAIPGGTNINNNKAVQWLNPISYFNPVDNVVPSWDKETEILIQGASTNISNSDYLFGKIDLLVDVEDSGINANMERYGHKI